MNGAQSSIHNTHYGIRTVYCLLLTIFFALALAQLTTTSPTFDEGYTLLRGYAALRTGHLVPIGHPPLAHWLSALGVILEPNLPDPRTLDGWAGDQYDDSSSDLMWKRGLNAGRLTFLGRYPILLLGLILGAVTARWAKELFGWEAAMAALALHALSPNLLANAALATTDLPVAAFYVFTLYAWYRFTKKPNTRNAILTGIFLGCALTSKFSALLLGPTLGLLFLLNLFNTRAQKHKGTKNYFLSALVPLCLRGLLILVTAFLTAWATYGFALNPYPLAQYLRELTDLTNLATGGHTAYLLGQLSLKGWWYYHLVVFAVKTPLPLLILLFMTTALIVYSVFRKQYAIRNTQYALANVFLPASLYLLATITIFSLNVGYRYLLPALPLLHILAASVTQHAIRNTRYAILLTLLFIAHAASTLAIAPHFLAYFNEFVGPENGYQVLADSNLDWGQDLPALARALDGRPVYLSYFGQADPAYYGINATRLPGWPPPDDVADFSPADPAPGLYAISASNFVGAQLDQPNTFAYFRNLTPLAVINYSIFVYEVPEREPVTSFAQCAPPILATTTHLLNRQARQLTFDCANSILLPAHPGLILYPEDQTPIIDLGQPAYEWKRSDGTTYYRLYRSSITTRSGQLLITNNQLPITNSKYLSLLNYDLSPEALTLTWLVTEPAPPPVSIFVHFNWPDGALAEAYDALGVPAEYWQAGDIIVQRHPISPDLPPGEYGIRVGLYSLADGKRYSDIPLTSYQK
ncbi:MAG: glycosyltransferase family 39 protein [Chloroflexi bacterium]|nr:glycosyltransferase family 39 protein [Chloroflexota bacterium]